MAAQGQRYEVVLKGATRLQLVERHVICKGDPRYAKLDTAAYASKNLWNLANYYVRQSFIFDHKYLNNAEVYHLVKSSDAYKALPAKVSNQVLIQLHQAWIAYFEAIAHWGEQPEQFLGRPRLPKYKHKTQGRNLLVNGRVLKSINQGYNKQREHLQKQLAKQDRLTSRRLPLVSCQRQARHPLRCERLLQHWQKSILDSL